MQTGRKEQALAQAQRAIEVDPLSERALATAARIHGFARMNEQALAEARRAAGGAPFFVVPYTLSQMGRYEEAIREFKRFARDHGPAIRGHMAYALARAGKTDEARAILRQLQAEERAEGVGSYEIAFVYAALGSSDEAFNWLDKAYRQRDPGLTYLKIDHTLDSLRDDPRFAALVLRVGLPP